MSIKDIVISLIGLGGSLGINSLLKELFPQFKIPSYEELRMMIANKEIQENFLVLSSVFLLVCIFILFIWLSLKIMNLDNLYKDKQRYLLLERLLKIWDFDVDIEVTSVECIPENNLGETVYINLTFSKSKFNELLDESLGAVPNANYLMLRFILKYLKGLLRKLEIFLLGYFFPVIFLISSIVLELFVKQIDILKIEILYWFLILACDVLFLIFYLSQMDLYTKEIKTGGLDLKKKYKFIVEKRIKRKLLYCILFLYLIPPITLYLLKKVIFYNYYLLVIILLVGFLWRIRAEEISDGS